MRPSSLVPVVILTLIALGLPAHAQSTSQLQRVWAVDDGERIRQNRLDHPLATDYTNNKVWNGSQISIFGGRNEVVAFQLMLESGASGAANVTVELASLSNGSTVIQNSPESAGNPYSYVGKRIELFREHYVSVPSRSSCVVAWWSAARPLPDSDYLGYLPDALIPFEAPGMGGAPFSIAARRNQGVWVDIYIPKNIPAGTYTGTLKVKEGTLITRQIPVSLLVYNFTLPDQTHFKSAFHVARDTEGFSLSHGVTFSLSSQTYKDLEERYFEMAQRHKMQLGFRTTPQNMALHYGKYVSGSHFTAANGYEGPGMSTPYSFYSIGTYDQTLTSSTGTASGFTPDTETGWRAASDAWVNWFETNSPSTMFFKYMHDEPDSDTEIAAIFPRVQERATWIRNNPGPGRRLKLFETVLMDPRLYTSLDLFAVTGQSGYYDPAKPNIFYNGSKGGYWTLRANEWRSLGKKIGIYNNNRPSFGAVNLIDTPGIDSRIVSWAGWKYRVDFYFLWLADRWNKRVNGVWTARNIYQDVSSPYGYGDGSFFYPGQQVAFPSSSPGLAGPVASIRMKNWRRGAQDYEYLWLAQSIGAPTAGIVNAVVPRAFDDYNGTTYTSQSSQPLWAQRGYSYESARRQIAQLLSGVIIPGDTTAPTCSITSPGSGATLNGVVTISASATDNVGVTRVELFVDGVLKGSDTSSPYSYSWDSTPAANTTHTLLARAYDGAGNVGSSTPVGVLVNNPVMLDSVGPTMSFISPSSGSRVRGTVTVSASATDPSGVARVEFRVNGVLKNTDTAAPWSWSWDARPYRGQTVTISAKGFDSRGNPTTVSVSVRVK